MKPAMEITTAILVGVLAAGGASAQNPGVIQNTRDTMNGVSNQATAASNDALGLHQSGVRKTVPAAGSAKPAVAKSSGVALAPAKSSSPGSPSAFSSPAGTKPVPAVAARHSVPPKRISVAPKSNPRGTATLAGNGAAGSGEGVQEAEQGVAPDGKTSANGRRDPFLSPVVSHTGGPACSTGKKCLEIGTISLRGVVHADSGFIAVVSNSLNKAYFLRENDPVFNGYVMRITGDSIVFQETLQDRLGKSFTREVVKKITVPVV